MIVRTKINETYFGNREYVMHTDNVAEAPGYADDKEAEGFINFINSKDTSCAHHDHSEHFPNSDENYIVLTPECIDTNSNATADDTGTLDGISAFFHKLLDAANRYENKPMILKKIVMHKYIHGASAPPHADVFPLATLLYLNDDYEGGELYFPNQNFEIKPTAKSLLVFKGGGEYLHGVRQVKGNIDNVRPRYVVVAFWDYSNREDQDKFTKVADATEDIWRDKAGAAAGNILSRYGTSAKLLFPNKFPILDIKDFLTNEMIEIVRFLELNHKDDGDECWAPVCFREYWEKLNPDSDRQPIFTDDTNENTLKDINLKIKEHVQFFMQRELKFSKFKGHRAVAGASAPPHNHPPAVAVAMIALDNLFSGGEVFIPDYDIEFSLEPGHLYIFEESQLSKHGFRKVLEGRRLTLVSHWQEIDHTYDWAGVDY